MNHTLSAVKAIICIIISAALLCGCGGGSGGGGGVSGGGGSDSGAVSQSSTSVGWGNVPVPSGYTPLPVTLSVDTLTASLKSQSGVRDFSEAYLMLVYHSQTPSSTGNKVPAELTLTASTKDEPLSIGGDYLKLMPDIVQGTGSYSASTAGSIALASSKDPDAEQQARFDRYERNHLDLLHHSFDLIGAMQKQGRAPGALTADELREKGKLDSRGVVKADTVGTAKNFWIYTASSSTFQITACTCRAVGQNCYVYTNNNDSSYYSNMDQYASQIASYFDSTVYPAVHQNIGYEWSPGIDGDPRIYIVLSVGINNSYVNFADEYRQSQLPAGERSNECEAIYADPMMFSGTGEAAETQLSVLQAVTGHELTHMVRFNMKYIASYGTSPIAFTEMAGDTDSDETLHEGSAIYTENVLLNRGVTSNSNVLATMRARNLERYLRSTSKSTMTSAAFNKQNNSGLGTYEMGFFIVEYLYERLGASSIKTLNQADGKLGLDSLRAASGGSSFNDIFDMQSLTILLSGMVGDPLYTLKGADLSGSTSYGGYTLHDAWSAVTNTNDLSNGVDVSQVSTSASSLSLYEWSPIFIRLYKPAGKTLSIKITGFTPGGGAGNVNAYAFYK